MNDDGWKPATPKEHQRRLKGVEAFTFLVALLAASFAILGFMQGSEDTSVHPTLGWVIISTPIWYVAYFAFCSACHYLFDAKVRYDWKESGLGFVFCVFAVSILLDSMGIISLF